MIIIEPKTFHLFNIQIIITIISNELWQMNRSQLKSILFITNDRALVGTLCHFNLNMYNRPSAERPMNCSQYWSELLLFFEIHRIFSMTLPL